MRQLALTILATVMMFNVAVSAANAAETIQWATNLEQARIAAAEQNKLLLIHFWTPDCKPCKVVESNVFPLPNVARAVNENFVPFKVNANERSDLRIHFKVEQWPTDIVSTVDGQAVHRMVTDQNPNRYIHKLLTVATQNAQAQKNDSFSASSQPMPSQQAQSQQPRRQSQWADGVHAPELTSSAAIARRPGVDPTMRPGVSGEMLAPGYHAMQPPEDPGAEPSRFDSPTSNFGSRNFGNGNHGTGTAARNSRTNSNHTPPSEISNRYVSADVAKKLDYGSTFQSAGREISNPYASGQQADQIAANNPAAPQSNTRSNMNPQTNTVAPRPQMQGTAAPSIQQTTAAPHQSPVDRMASSQPSFRSERDVIRRNDAAPGQSGPALGLDGRCPVTLISAGKWRKGNKQWGAIHRGKTYLFAGPGEQQKFLAKPDDFSPVLAGMDVVQLADNGQVTEGTRRFGVLYDNDGVGPNSSRIYLFDSETSRNRFEASPDEFLRPVMQAMQHGNLNMLRR